MTRSGVRALAILTVLALAAHAHAESDMLKNARDTFEYGNYAESGQLAESLLQSQKLTEERELVDAYRIAGLSAFYLNHPVAARRHFVALLSVDPDFSMDPFLVPPAAVAFFDGVKRDNENLLGPIRDRRKTLAEQERLAEGARRRLLEENMMRQLEPDRPVLVQRIEVHTYVTNFVPFGAGQFQEGRPGTGAFFATTQLVGLAAAIGCFAKIESLRDSNGRYAGQDIGTANNLAIAKWAGLGMFGASMGLGIADSLLNFQSTSTRIEALQQPPNHAPSPKAADKPGPAVEPASTPAPVAAPPSKPQTLRPLIFPWATSASIGVGLGMHF